MDEYQETFPSVTSIHASTQAISPDFALGTRCCVTIRRHTSISVTCAYPVPLIVLSLVCASNKNRTYLYLYERATGSIPFSCCFACWYRRAIYSGESHYHSVIQQALN